MRNLATDMHFNLVLYCLLALFGYLSGVFGSDEAAKYMRPSVLFWMKTTFGALAAITLSAKMFLSTTYAEWQHKRKSNGRDTSFVLQPAPTGVQTARQ